MAGGCAWQGCVWWGVCVTGGVSGRGVHDRYYEIRSMSGQYASYLNAFLFICFLLIWKHSGFSYFALD